ncbi:RNA recognition motif-containing protein [Phytophthora infestans]|uniref:RNA recognition motif-containing protein n=1 Tax=Phytophthora infestans TaxID=4787 RepID=A0A833T477_PHYIN|nr:RNA recognition motif-containing protein [Phytophthora infestans]KAI9992532.1 hypothetical protein PInf_017951 [Phytophthora infestans]
MPETSAPAAHEDEPTPSPSTVGNTFMRQYYHFLAKEPQSLHRFYKAESRWCHGVGSHMEEPIAGQRAINDQILKRGYAGARVDLDAGSIDCQNSLGGGVLVLVTGVMTLRDDPVPKPFVQTFFLAVQPKGYFVLNDCLRFLELPGASPVDEVKDKENGKAETPKSPVKVETPVPLSPKKAASPVQTIKTTTTKVVKEAAPASPVKATATVASSPVKKTTTTTTTTTKEVETPAVKTPSPVKSPAKSPEKSPKKQDKAPTPASPASAPADPVVTSPAEPEKPKTWAALFSGSKPASVTPSAPVSTPVKPSTPKAAPAPAPASITPTTNAPAPEKSPKNKTGNGKEKEHKRLHSLFIRDVPAQTSENDLRELFKSYGSIAGVSVVAQRGFAFVDYYEQESMRAALAETKELKVFDKVLQVDERAERKDGQRGSFRSNDTRGRGRGHGPKSGRGDRKERNGDEASSKGERREAPRREKTGNRRGGKVDATS